MDRTELAIHHLSEEWQNVIVICSGYDEETGETELARHISGNAYAIQQMLENEAERFMFGGLMYGGEAKEESGEEQQED